MKLNKKKIIIGIAAIAFIAGFAYFKFGSKPKAEYTSVKAERGRLVQTVSETGTVKAASELNLNFINNGKLAKLLVKVGDKVKKDQNLAELDHSSLDIRRRQAEANLSKLLNGATMEDLRISEANMNQSKAAYDSAVKDLDKIKKTVSENIAQAKKTLEDLEAANGHTMTTYEQAVSTAEASLENTKKTYQQVIDNRIDSSVSTAEDKLDAADTALDNVNKLLADDNARHILSVKNTSYLSSAKSGYDDAKNLISAAVNSLNAAKRNKTANNVYPALEDALEALNKVSDTLSSTYKVLENTITTPSFTQATLDAYKTAISAQQTIISSAISSVQGSRQGIKDAELSYAANLSAAENSLAQARVNLDNIILTSKNAYSNAKLSGDQQITSAQSRIDSSLKAWEISKAQYEKIKAPARREDIALALADVDSAKSQIENSIIKAPLDGIITKSNYEVGEDVSPANPVFAMLGEDNFEIEALVSEADIAKVNRDDKTEITLDAFGGDIKFNGSVFFIEPASTVVQDVVYYKIKARFADLAEVEQKAGDGTKVKPGMTANMIITTAEKDNILKIPSRAIIEKADGSKVARVLANGSLNEVRIETGLRGDEGMIEVVSGNLKEGDDVVTFVK